MIHKFYEESWLCVSRSKRCADRGIYTILDMHQDVLSSLYDAYDGAPLWLMESFPEPTNPYPWPLEKIDAWALGYLTQVHMPCIYWWIIEYWLLELINFDRSIRETNKMYSWSIYRFVQTLCHSRIDCLLDWSVDLASLKLNIYNWFNPYRIIRRQITIIV